MPLSLSLCFSDSFLPSFFGYSSIPFSVYFCRLINTPLILVCFRRCRLISVVVCFVYSNINYYTFCSSLCRRTPTHVHTLRIILPDLRVLHVASQLSVGLSLLINYPPFHPLTTQPSPSSQFTTPKIILYVAYSSFP